jgi:hypothetical protein
MVERNLFSPFIYFLQADEVATLKLESHLLGIVYEKVNNLLKTPFGSLNIHILR